jgi:AraC-like DNA-binding protein
MSLHFWCKNLLLFLFPIALLGQVTKNDLETLSYSKLKQLYVDQKTPAKQITYAGAYINKAKKEKNNKQIAGGYYLLSLLYKEDKALNCLDSVIKYATNTDDLNFPIAAYCEKALILEKQSKFNLAIENLLLAEKYADDNHRTDDYYALQYYIAVTKSENLGEVSEALDKYRVCYRYYESKGKRLPKYAYPYQMILFAIADSHKTLQQLDSATYYNKLGYQEAIISNNKEMVYSFILNEGANQVLRKNYKSALDSVNKALPQMIAFKDEGNILASYYYLGKIYAGIGKGNIAAKNFIKVDSMYKANHSIHPEFIGGYPFLVSYYKNTENKIKQLEYLTTYITINDSLQKSHNKMYKLLVKEYDIPHLIKDKQILIQSLQNQKSWYHWGIGGLLVVVIGLVYYSIYQQKLKKTYRTRFEKIIAETAINPITNNTSTIVIEENKTKDLEISKNLKLQILDKLDAFELEKGYLQPNITATILGETFVTNSKYLTAIIKEYRNKSFIQYINDLRIDNAVVSLQQDNDLMKYTIEAIAVDFGFNNAESFALAFQKKTGLKPSFFIKELKKNKT